jgi:hypothetical protein
MKLEALTVGIRFGSRREVPGTKGPRQKTLLILIIPYYLFIYYCAVIWFIYCIINLIAWNTE